MAHAYFVEGLAGVTAGATITVTGAEAHHALRVARLRVGEMITLLDGAGCRATGEVIATNKTDFTVRANENAQLESLATPRIVLVQALAKGGRDEMAVQAAVELGIDGIVPWQAQRSVAKWHEEKRGKQRERWQAIAREAAKQSVRAYVPEVLEVVTTKQLAALATSFRLIVLDPLAQAPLRELAASGGDIALIVGPEGGIDAQEFAVLEAAGAQRYRLGRNVLRTSTAGPAALATLLTSFARW